MEKLAILWPAFALFALSMAVVVRLARLRFAAAAAGRVDPRFYKAFRGEGEPEELAVTARNYNNLHEMPTLFYAGTAIAFAGGIGGVLVWLGWAYVALRYLHTAIHLGSNKVRWRFRVFAASWLVLLGYWATLGVSLVRSAAAG